MANGNINKLQIADSARRTISGGAAALRKAVLDALVQRDYMVPGPTQIRLYGDRLVLWKLAALPDEWTQETLLGPHQSQPHNPDIVNAFFRAGEIEAWGRGFECVFAACREAAAHRPQIRLETGGLWMEFPVGDDYLRAAGQAAGHPPITEPRRKSSGKGLGIGSGRTVARILARVKKEPGPFILQMAAALGITPWVVEKQIRQLKAIGRLRRVGAAKGGLGVSRCERTTRFRADKTEPC